MSNTTQENSRLLKAKAINMLDSLLSKYIKSNDSRADKLSYWIKDYSNYLKFEESFDPKRNKRYKRGDVVKINLGYNIGREEGGLHYCIILDKHNDLSSGTVTVIPLSSKKEGKSYPKKYYIDIGNELFNNLLTKIKQKCNIIDLELNALEANVLKLSNEEFDKERARIEKEIDFLASLRKEISQMNKGSVALVSQITTVSKMRIVDPKTSAGVLTGIKVSDELLDKIDSSLLKLFFRSQE